MGACSFVGTGTGFSRHRAPKAPLVRHCEAKPWQSRGIWFGRDEGNQQTLDCHGFASQ
jgi:hypothetical protein